MVSPQGHRVPDLPIAKFNKTEQHCVTESVHVRMRASALLINAAPMFVSRSCRTVHVMDKAHGHLQSDSHIRTGRASSKSL